MLPYGIEILTGPEIQAKKHQKHHTMKPATITIYVPSKHLTNGQKALAIREGEVIEFNSREKAERFLIDRAEAYFSGPELEEKIDEIVKYGVLEIDSVTASIN